MMVNGLCIRAKIYDQGKNLPYSEFDKKTGGLLRCGGRHRCALVHCASRDNGQHRRSGFNDSGGDP